MFDTRPALADMASQIRTCRSAEGLTLQQLASRSGVAASTIHKVESQQMVPTVSVLLKIAKGLGTRPEDLIRDTLSGSEDGAAARSAANPSEGRLDASAARTASREGLRRAGVWRLALDRDRALPAVVLGAEQRAMVLVENGPLHLLANDHSVEMQAGDCIEVQAGERIESMPSQPGPAAVTLIVSPPGDLARVLGAPLPTPAKPL